MTASWWTPADAAELDVLTFELSRCYLEHRQQCEACRSDCRVYESWREHLETCLACRGDAPLTYGPPCAQRRVFIEHGNACPRCNPCPHVQKAIRSVLEWREARELRSRAEWLRAERQKFENVA